MQYCSEFSKMIQIFQLRLKKCFFWYCNLFWYCELFYTKINYQLMMNETSLMTTYLMLLFEMCPRKVQLYRFCVWCFLSKTCTSSRCLEPVAERWSQASHCTKEWCWFLLFKILMIIIQTNERWKHHCTTSKFVCMIITWSSVSSLARCADKQSWHVKIKKKCICLMAAMACHNWWGRSL